MPIKRLANWISEDPIDDMNKTCRSIASRHNCSVTNKGNGTPILDVNIGDILVHFDFDFPGNTNTRAGFLLGRGPDFACVSVKTDSISNEFHILRKILRYGPQKPHVLSDEFIFYDYSSHNKRFKKHFSNSHSMKERCREAIENYILIYGNQSIGGSRCLEGIVSNGNVVHLYRSGYFSNEEIIERDMRFVGEIATFGSEVIEPTLSLPGLVWVPPNGPWNARTAPYLHTDSRDVLIYPTVVAGVLSVTIIVKLVHKLPIFKIACDSNCNTNSKKAISVELMRKIIHPLISKTGEARIECDSKRIQIVPIGDLDIDRLLKVTSGYSAIISPPASPYRD